MGRPFVFRNGALPVPDKPGIGVELDREAFAHYERLYLDIGEFSGYAPLDGISPLSKLATGQGERS